VTISIPSVFLWQALRKALRAYKDKKDLSGNDLRPVKSADSRGGEFLEKLVAWGLLKVVDKAPDPLDAVYRITWAGGQAAEYGWWDGEPGTWKAIVPKQAPKPKPKETKQCSSPKTS
jgi:hypothetical protein